MLSNITSKLGLETEIVTKIKHNGATIIELGEGAPLHDDLPLQLDDPQRGSDPRGEHPRRFA